ncbi:uncharacterized protein J7T54_008088 [Emericellopsis cladophorae]|uniref:tRNA-intron lyase n=1 Tax=Emericellopsis cladophorae TaxID=2686198 RepID=A0A9P9Y903_9HYPO|nr:uncharacterized protein J7T54_008088 [Emericellopsis cladophorae]KAI6784994.1 hypothetical protein J7T54_008088 [Emericellopsis cladophorae]
MAEPQPVLAEPPAAIPSTTPNGQAGQKKEQHNQNRGPPPHTIYVRPVPIRTFPLPSFYPNNPVSLFHLAYAWLSQVFSPPPAEPSAVLRGTWSPETSSVHVTDDRVIRALWEQGFYGKGSLSRSEPNWLKREQVRRGLQETHVSEVMTAQRRDERLRAKWERARLEQELIRQTREAEQAEQRRLEAKSTPASSKPKRSTPEVRKACAQKDFASPTGPHELLALPNSLADLALNHSAIGKKPSVWAALSPTGPLEILALPNSAVDLLARSCTEDSADVPSLVDDHDDSGEDEVSSGQDASDSTPTNLNGTAPPVIPGLHILRARMQKSVRFSPDVEQAAFSVADPPSPSRKVGDMEKSDGDNTPSDVIVNKEHLQLMPEEALWLSFGLGALAVNDPLSGRQLSTRELLALFRQHSYFPPRDGPDDLDLQPDDGFLLHYAVYHHFRSLGWVPRSGIKFGVDWLLYQRGPVFDHAEFGLVVVPSYSDPYWRTVGKSNPQKKWEWLHSIIRVLSHVMKSLVLVYVEVPPPRELEKSLDKGFASALKLYKVREVMIKRWSSNRNR